MLDQQGVARIGNAARRSVKQSELAVGIPDQHHDTIAGHAASIKSALNLTPAHAAKFNLRGSKFFGTVWHWRSYVVIGLRYQ